MLKKFIHTTLVQAERIEVSDDFFYKIEPYDAKKIVFDEERFKQTFFEITDEKEVSDEVVDSFIENTEVTMISNKTVMVKATLINGFEIVETASKVDKTIYNNSLEFENKVNQCMDKIKAKTKDYLGFMLCCAYYGNKKGQA